MNARVINDLEQVCEVKFGQVGIANLRIKQWDMERLCDELRQKVSAAPQLFQRAPLIVDFSHLPHLPTLESARDLIGMIRDCGLLPVGLAYGTRENEELAGQLDLPLLAKFRTAFERDNGEPVAAARPAPIESNKTSAPESGHAKVESQNDDSATTSTYTDKPVRSGQQLYAKNGDLIITNLVGNGAEVIADGSIHVYGALRGRALAGAQGNEKARIFCQEFHAELVSIAGVYRVIEDIPPELRGKPVQAWLEKDKLLLGKLG